MTEWMVQLQDSDKKLVEMASEKAEATTYNGTIREALLFYLENKGGDSPDAE